MNLTPDQRGVLAVMARTPAEQPWPLHRIKAGPSLPLPDWQWCAVQQADVDALVEAGLLAPVYSDGHADRVAYWLITEAGRASVAEPVMPEPVPAKTTRRRSTRPAR